MMTRFEDPQSPGDVEIDESHDDDRLLLDAEAASNYIAGLISGFTGDEVDGDGDAYLADRVRQVPPPKSTPPQQE